MKKGLMFAACAAMLAGGLVWAAVRLQEEPTKPGKEHEFLKNFEGSWTTVGKFIMGPGTDPVESKGTCTAKVGCNGLWLIMDYQGEMMQQPFTGHGVMGYDVDKKKFVSCWADSMSTRLDLAEGMLDEKAKTITLKSTWPDPVAKKDVEWTSVYMVKDKDTWTLQFFMPGEGGKAMETGSIEFKRKK